MRRRTFVVAAACLAPVVMLATTRPLLAHHAWTEIDTSKTVTLTGVVDALKWENPHASLTLRVRDGDADVLWTIELSGIARMQAHGFDAAMLAKGATLTIVASPARDERRTARANRIRIDGKDHVLY